jgi:hypothetical protein
MHFRQKEWPQGRVMGSQNTPAHTGQLSGSGQVWPGRYKRSFPFLLRKILDLIFVLRQIYFEKLSQFYGIYKRKILTFMVVKMREIDKSHITTFLSTSG